MIFKEEKCDLFNLDNKYALAHCISNDCAMGTTKDGRILPCVATEFIKRFPKMKIIIKIRKDPNGIGTCCLYAECKDDKWIRIFNLITKEKYWLKPTYDTLKSSLLDLKKQCEHLDIKFIAIPKIGSGLDRLSWSKVREIIKEVFKDTDIEILVCYL